MTPAGKPWTLWAGVRYFWQLHPKAFAVDRGALRIFAYPDTAGAPLRLHVGAAKTHVVFLVPQRARDSAPAVASARGLTRPVMYYPVPQSYCDSMVWGQVLPRRKGRFTLYETEAARTIRADFVTGPERTNAYGMLNFGDVGSDNRYTNLETAYDHGLAVQFIRTGDREVFDCLERAVWHFRDVDVQQARVPGEWDWGLWLIPGYMPAKLARECARDATLRDKLLYATGTHPPAIGGVHRPSYLHFANASDNPVSATTRYVERRLKLPAGSCDVGADGWIVGLVDHYLLTGDRRALEVAELAGPWVLNHGGTGWSRDNWQCIDLAWLYRATGKAEYLDRLRQVIDVICADPEATVERIAARDKTLMSPFYTVLQFIKHVHQLTGDPEVKRKYLGLVTKWIDSVPTTDSHIGPVFRYIRDWRDDRCHTDFADLAYAYLLSGDRKYLDKSLTTLDLYLHFAYHSTAFFSVPEYLYALDKAGIEAFTDPPPTLAGARAFWRDEDDVPVQLVVYQQSGYRVAAGDAAGQITLTAPSGKETQVQVTRGGMDVYRLTVPADGERGTCAVTAAAPGCAFAFGANVPLFPSPPPEYVAGKFGKAVKLMGGAFVDLPAPARLNLEQGLLEFWFQPLWDSPTGRTQAVPFHYHQLFDSRNGENDYGLAVYLYDSGEVGAGECLVAMWADRDKSDAVGMTMAWKQGEWHHIAFGWMNNGDGTGKMQLHVDGKLVGAKSRAANFPAHFSPAIRLGMSSTASPRTPANGVIDELRISRKLRAPELSGPLPADDDTLFLEHFEAPAPGA